jgi:myo-inositol 2-dehydrogenase/D-chiro-inositol 1-dehydrogenase
MSLAIGVIGTGAIGQDHIRRISQTLSGARVVAVNDINPLQAKATVDQYLLAATVHDSAQALIHDPAVEAVLVTSWGPSHEEFVLAAIAAGKPVFCEKPLAVTAEAACASSSRTCPWQTAGASWLHAPLRRRLPRAQASTAGRSYRCSADVALRSSQPSVGEGYTTPMAITDTLIHELDVLRWLLDEDYVSAQVVFPRKSSHALPHLADPQIVLLETRSGVRIDVEIFVNCQYGYDIQCQIVGETGIASLPEPSSVPLRSAASYSTAILTDWKQRFIAAYDVELQAFIDGVQAGAHRPSAWDGYAAAVAADACVLAQQNGAVVGISMPERPGFY